MCRENLKKGLFTLKTPHNLGWKVESSIVSFPPYFGGNNVALEISDALIQFAHKVPEGTDVNDIPQMVLDDQTFRFSEWGEQMYVSSTPDPRFPKKEIISQNINMLKRWVLTVLGNQIAPLPLSLIHI